MGSILTLGTASAGAIGKSIGAVAASAKATILARGVTLCLLAACSVMSTQAAAPSFNVLALAAVIVPTIECSLPYEQHACHRR